MRGEPEMDLIEQRILDIIDRHREEILSFAKDIEQHPEPGFEEMRTAEKAAEFLSSLGYEVQSGLARTGVRGDWIKKEGPNVTIIGEMDAIGCRTHPKADPENGTAHACGHHARHGILQGHPCVSARHLQPLHEGRHARPSSEPAHSHRPAL